MCVSKEASKEKEKEKERYTPSQAKPGVCCVGPKTDKRRALPQSVAREASKQSKHHHIKHIHTYIPTLVPLGEFPVGSSGVLPSGQPTYLSRSQSETKNHPSFQTQHTDTDTGKEKSIGNTDRRTEAEADAHAHTQKKQRAAAVTVPAT